MKTATAPKTETASASTETASSTPNRFVPLAQLVHHPKLTYRPIDPVHVESLFNSIIDSGLDTPLFTFNIPGESQMRIKGSDRVLPATYLVAGNHRREALRKLLAEKPAEFKKQFPNGVPVIHRELPLTKAVFMQLRENIQRRDMTAEEIFPVLESLTEEPFNLSQKEIAKQIGKSQAWVTQHMNVNTQLDDETKREVLAGDIDVGDARVLAGKVRKERKSGKEVTTAAIRAEAEKLKSKKAAKVASGQQRATGDDRRVSARKLWSRVQALRQIPLGRKVLVLTEAVQYLAGETDKLPAELRTDPKPTKVEPAKK